MQGISGISDRVANNGASWDPGSFCVSGPALRPSGSLVYCLCICLSSKTKIIQISLIWTTADEHALGYTSSFFGISLFFSFDFFVFFFQIIFIYLTIQKFKIYSEIYKNLFSNFQTERQKKIYRKLHCKPKLVGKTQKIEVTS